MRVLERICRLSLGECQVRIWMAAVDLRDQEEAAAQLYFVQSTIDRIKTFIPEDDVTALVVAEIIANSCPFCNAVEVTTAGTGVLIYPEWP